MDEESRQLLEQLDRNDLLELLSRIHGRDESIDREIAAYVRRGGPVSHGRQLREWMRSWTGGRGFYSYREAAELSREIEDVVAEIHALLGIGDAASTLELVEDFLRTSVRVLERVDDSMGSVSDAFREGAALWLRAARRCRDAGLQDDWIARVQQLINGDGYGLLDDLLPQASILLSHEELLDLARRFEACALKADDQDDYEALRARTNLGLLAWALRDPSLYVRSVTLGSPELNELQRESIVRCHLELDDPQGALEWLDGPWSHYELSRLSLRASAFQALGQSDQVVAARRQVWDLAPSVAHLEALLEVLPPAEQDAVKSEAVERAAGSEIVTALELLLFLEQPVRAEAVLLERYAELDGYRYATLKEVAKALEAARRPLAASLVYRALLDSVLERGYSRAYDHAARYYRRLGELASGVEDWHGVARHRSYIDGLWGRHGRKRSFWSRVGGAPQG